MEDALQRRCFSILESPTSDELHARLLAATEQLGFSVFGAMVVLDSPQHEPTFICLNNMSPEAEILLGDPVVGKTDPVMQHCKINSTPIVWDQATYARTGMTDKWEAQAPLGYRSGICVAMHLPQGRHFLLGVQSDGDLPARPVGVVHLTSALLMLVVYAQEVSMRLLSKTSCDRSGADLTPRELEVLRWTMEGKTAWEVGRILSIAENTVIRHAQSATRKLEGANKHHAAVKAWRAGLIS